MENTDWLIKMCVVVLPLGLGLLICLSTQTKFGLYVQNRTKNSPKQIHLHRLYDMVICSRQFSNMT